MKGIEARLLFFFILSLCQFQETFSFNKTMLLYLFVHHLMNLDKDHQTGRSPRLKRHCSIHSIVHIMMKCFKFQVVLHLKVNYVYNNVLLFHSIS